MDLIGNYRLSWELLGIVFFGIIIAYSFIVGKDRTIKIILSAYVSILCADGLGNVLDRYILPAAPALQDGRQALALVFLKLFIFVVTIVLLTVRGGFEVKTGTEGSFISRIITTLCFGIFNGGLIVSTILVYISGASFINGSVEVATQTDIYQESAFIRLMIDNHNLWFALPALSFVFLSLIEVKRGLSGENA